jgi:hypothetical protein
MKGEHRDKNHDPLPGPLGLGGAHEQQQRDRQDSERPGPARLLVLQPVDLDEDLLLQQREFLRHRFQLDGGRRVGVGGAGQDPVRGAAMGTGDYGIRQSAIRGNNGLTIRTMDLGHGLTHDAWEKPQGPTS